MLESYQDQVCIVTGSSSGIGEAFAHALAERGAKVVLFARRADRLRVLETTLKCETLIVSGDVTQADHRERLMQQTLDHFGRIDVLINNAGKDDSANFLKISAEEAAQILYTNLVGAVLLTHQIAPVMVRQKHGLIMNVSSVMGDIQLPRAALYVTTKAGLNAFSRSLYRELKPQGVHVMNFIPGYTRSEMVPEHRDHKLPRYVRVRPARDAVELALDAALKGKPYLFTGEHLTTWLMRLNRNFPRALDRILARYWRS